jgi:glycosyltransferase involved in cell wall biosynthesis
LGEVPVPPNVTIHYNTGHQQTIDLIANATLHCIPLYPTDFSAGQTVLLRAMARGKAVVVTETPGIRDYVRDGENAVLVPPGDAEALRSALTRLWNDAGERQRIGTSAAQTVRREFGFENFTTKLATIAREITGTT